MNGRTSVGVLNNSAPFAANIYRKRRLTLGPVRCLYPKDCCYSTRESQPVVHGGEATSLLPMEAGVPPCSPWRRGNEIAVHGGEATRSPSVVDMTRQRDRRLGRRGNEIAVREGKVMRPLSVVGMARQRDRRPGGEATRSPSVEVGNEIAVRGREDTCPGATRAPRRVTISHVQTLTSNTF